MDLVGKSHEQIDAALRGVERSRVIAALKTIATAEPFFSPEQIAQARQISVAAVMKRIRARQLRAHLIGNRWRIPLSALQEWDRQTAQVTG